MRPSATVPAGAVAAGRCAVAVAVAEELEVWRQSATAVAAGSAMDRRARAVSAALASEPWGQRCLACYRQ